MEFALVAPLLIVLLFGMIDFGWALNRYTVLNNAAREGVRAASLGSSEDEVEQVVQDYLGDLDGVDVTVSCTRANGTSCPSWDSAASSGGTALVTVTYDHTWLTFVGPTITDELHMEKSSKMRIE